MYENVSWEYKHSIKIKFGFYTSTVRLDINPSSTKYYKIQNHYLKNLKH